MRRSVLVAGGAGYIGAHVCKALHRRGYLPVVIDDLSTGHREAVRWGPLIEADIADAEAVDQAVSCFEVGGAMHFAAKSLVGESQRDPMLYYQENVGKGATLFRNLWAAGVDNVLMSSTAAVYGEPQDHGPIPETAQTRPVNPYGATKLALEQALGWACRSGGGRRAVLRYFNAAGADSDAEIGEAHDPETHLIPLAIRAALGLGPAISVFGKDYPTPDGTAVRDYVHVEDLAEAHLLVYERMIAGEPYQTYNVGAERGSSVRDVIRVLDELTGRPTPARSAPRRAGDPSVLVADATKLRGVGWRPRHDLRSIISTAMAWHQTELETSHISLALQR